MCGPSFPGITSVRGKVTTRGKMMRSTLTAEYGAKMRQRVEAVKPKRHIKILTEASMGQAGSNLKMLQSGAMQTNAGFNTAASAIPIPVRSPFATLTHLYFCFFSSKHNAGWPTTSRNLLKQPIHRQATVRTSSTDLTRRVARSTVRYLHC